MEIKYHQLKALSAALTRIKTECRLPVVKALHVKRLCKKVLEEVSLYNEQYTEILMRHSKKDEKGNSLITELTNGTRVEISDLAAFGKDMKELSEQSFEIDDPEIDLEDLGQIQLTAEEIESLESILGEE